MERESQRYRKDDAKFFKSEEEKKEKADPVCVSDMQNLSRSRCRCLGRWHARAYFWVPAEVVTFVTVLVSDKNVVSSDRLELILLRKIRQVEKRSVYVGILELRPQRLVGGALLI